MLNKTQERLRNSITHWSECGAKLRDRRGGLPRLGSEEMTRAFNMNFFLFDRFVEGALIPTMQSMASINRDISDSWVETIRGEKSLSAHLREMKARFGSGLRYDKLVGTLGRELFGSAKFMGEELLAENDFYALSYLPPKKGVAPQKAALFHAGGFLPFSDRIFRFLPESNLFMPFLERGVPVYAMELKGDKKELPNLGDCTLERHIDAISELSAIAFDHNQGRQLMLEGYCGLGMQALSYLAAKPEEAEARFNVAFTMVAPVDGRKCEILDDMMSTIPRSMITAQNAISELFGGYVSGDDLRTGLDLSLGSFFHKWPIGRFTAGWHSGEYARVETVEDLSPSQRKELAGGYWISPHNSRRFPMPVDLSSFASRLWTRGIVDDHEIPYTYKGERLSLETLRAKTQLEVIGFYGGRDVVVPDATAQAMQKTLKRRYTHVVHPKAGHISYVLSPETYNADHRHALDPNPVELALSRYAMRDAKRKR